MKTNGWKVGAVRAALRTAQSLHGGTAAWLADRIFCTPPSSQVPAAVRTVLASGERGWVLADDDRVAVWRWGQGPAVALVHGWGSRAARLAAHVEPLVQQGFSVVAFDAPAHGESEGTLGSGIQAARALRAIAAATPLYGVVAHSLGAAATLLALREGLGLRRAVFLSPPSDIAVYAARFAELFGLRPDTLAAMKRRTERRLRFRWRDLDLIGIAAAIRGVELLLLHDKNDADVSWDNGARIAAAWGGSGATFVTTEGLGHHRIARDPAVVAQAARFLAAGAESRGREAAAAWLDEELFDSERLIRYHVSGAGRDGPFLTPER
jgi:pimeloyl-ACP methyl ester carboxylesterase